MDIVCARQVQQCVTNTETGRDSRGQPLRRI